MILVVAEKPSVAREYASYLGADQKHSGYYSGNGHLVSYCYGHLVMLATPEEYGYTEWKREHLPIFPEPFKLLPNYVIKGGTRIYDPGTQKQISVLRELIGRCSEIIIGTDAGKEGELIFRYLYDYLGIKKPMKRLWISSLTAESIKKGFASLRPAKEFDNLYHAGKCRSEADWLVGMNATQCISLAVGNRIILSVGRVQTPTLGMVCKRFIENRDFKPVPFYEVFVKLEKGTQFTLKCKDRFDTPGLARALEASLSSAGTMKIDKVEKREKREGPPLLYDLTALQKDANKKYGYSAEETLSHAQALYEGRKTTYPRTGSRYIGEDIYAEIPGLLKKLAMLDIRYERLCGAVNTPARKSVNDSKVTDHHAILPTVEIPAPDSFKNERERNVYFLIVNKTVEAFSPDCIKDVMEVESLHGNHVFRATGFSVRVPGWRAVSLLLGEKEDDDDGEGEKEANEKFPALSPGEDVKKLSQEVREGKTTAPPVLTESSLLELMETCGKKIADEELREAMKESGLGTPATRASIIETLIKRSYVTRDKKKIVPTAKGLALYELTKDMAVSSVEMTGEWEKKLSLISSGQMERTSFMKEIRDYVDTVIKEIDSSGEKIRSFNFTADSALKCPKCGGAVYVGPKNMGCRKFFAEKPEDKCDFSIFRTVAGKQLAESTMIKLIQTGRTGIIKGFKSKEDKPFEASLVLDSSFKLKFEFPKGMPKKRNNRNKK